MPPFYYHDKILVRWSDDALDLKAGNDLPHRTVADTLYLLLCMVVLNCRVDNLCDCSSNHDDHFHHKQHLDLSDGNQRL